MKPYQLFNAGWYAAIFLSLFFSSCKIGKDARDFSKAQQLQQLIRESIPASAETSPVAAPEVGDDAADDIAIWVNPNAPENSYLVGANKKGGMIVFDLTGKEIANYPTGRINNIDALYQFPLDGQLIDLIGCTNRSDQSIDLFKIDPTSGTLSDIASGALPIDTRIVSEVYGFCFYKSKQTGRSFAFVSGKNGNVLQLELIETANKTIDLLPIRTIPFSTQTEGLVADNELGWLYIGEEDKGIWKVHAEPDSSYQPQLISNSGEENPWIKYDIEGLTLYKIDSSAGYLIASSQGNFSYAVFEREEPNQYLGSFKITGNQKVDGAEETDGLEAVSAQLSGAYPKGILVVQDGFNFEGSLLQRQNFKIINFQPILQLIQSWKSSRLKSN